MKKIITLLTFLLLTGIVAAQENYTMKMTVRTEGLAPEDAAFGEQDIVTYVKGDKSKTEVTSMMFNSTIYFDGKTMTTLSEAMGNKSGFTATKEELDAENGNKNSKPKIEYTTEKRKIAGYDCTKAIITTTGEDNKPEVITVWITDKIKYDNARHKNSRSGMRDFGDLKGYPLAMEMNKNYMGTDMKIIMTTTDVSTEPIDDKVFTVNTDGYTMMSYKEMKEKAKSYKGH